MADANTYGSEGKNFFKLPDPRLKDNNYYVIVNADTGVTQVYRQGSTGSGDASIGTYNPSTGKFTPDNAINSFESVALIDPNGAALNQIKNSAITTATNAGLDPTKAQQLIKPNTSPTSPGSDQQSTLNAKTLDENLNKLKISDDPRTRLVSEYPDNLKYPLTMDGKQDCIRFTMLQYAPRKIDIPGISQGKPLSERLTVSTQTQERIRGKTVILPIQPTISDNNVVKWGSNEMNAGQLIAASAALATITEAEQGAIASIKQITDLFKGSASDLKTAFAAGFADAAAGTKGLLTRVTGGIVNPNMELLFEGPDLRTFTFNFSLSAREETEAKVIRNIIRFFKQGMSVKTSDVGLFLKSPHTFEIKYFHEGAEHPWINKIKECALTSCNVNYTPAGNYATYKDGAMTQYDITLSFSELEPIYDYEYDKGSTTYDSEIGY